MSDSDVALIAHLMRRAGFGATRSELDELTAKGYETVVEELLSPEQFPDIEMDVWKRYEMELMYNNTFALHAGFWVYRMVNTKRPLQEKMALFWHHVFATGHGKAQHTPSMLRQIESFRNYGLSDMNSILVQLAQDPAMSYWLDNCENHKDEPNENWGRELLELFSMGVGHYTEVDIKNASRAFTGWTFQQPPPLYPTGDYETKFRYVEEDHDDSEKTFLGETGNLNGEDIIGIIVKQRATARFIVRHMYNFFVADEPQVPSWELEPPTDPEAIDILVDAYFDSDGDIRHILRTLFNSDFFKGSQFRKVRSPAELVSNMIKVVGTYRFPDPKDGLSALSGATSVMGQQLMNPPTVEGWHTGHEWIDGGTLNARINFAVNQFNDLTKPGIKEMVGRLASQGEVLTPMQLVDATLDVLGPVQVDERTKEGLLKYAIAAGDLKFDTDEAKSNGALHIGRMLQLIVSTREFQFA